MKVIHCAEHALVNTRLHQLHWGDTTFEKAWFQPFAHPLKKKKPMSSLVMALLVDPLLFSSVSLLKLEISHWMHTTK